jgi:hypothetical protein
MRHKSGLPPKEARARDRVVQMAIGRMLSAQYDLAAPLSERLENLLKRLENTDEIPAVNQKPGTGVHMKRCNIIGNQIGGVPDVRSARV